MLAEHERQKARRVLEERDRRDRQPLIVVVGITVLVAAAAFISAGLVWWSLERGIRDDPSRCSPTVAEGVEIVLGGWAENDTCAYFDSAGQPVGVPESPGPVTKTYSDVLGDTSRSVVPYAIPVLGVIGIACAWQSRPSRRRWSSGRAAGRGAPRRAAPHTW